MTQLFIDGTLADINDRTDFTLTLESNILTGAADFKGNRSLTITLPATSRNQELIGHADKVQGGDGKPYDFHTVEMFRDGVPIIQGGIGRILQTTPDNIQVAVTWGVRTSVDALLASDKTLNDIVTDAAIEFNSAPVVSAYADATTDEVFYAAMDCERHVDTSRLYRLHVVLGDDQWDVTSLNFASSYLHPSVRMDWLLDKLENMFSMTFDFGGAATDIATLIVPLVNKIPNDITFNGGFKAGCYEPSQWGGALTGNFIQFKTTNDSPIIAETTTDPMTGHLTCATAFSGLIKFSIYFYIDKADLRSISAPVYKPKYGYRLDVNINGVTKSVTMLDENYIIMADDINASDKVPIYATGYLPVSLDIGEWLTIRVSCIHNGQVDMDLGGGIHVQGGTIWINEIVGSLNEVQPTQMFPVEGNLPEIKPIDLIKFLCAVEGLFPVQSSTEDTLILKPVADVFDYSRAVDWSKRLLSPTDRAVAAQGEFTPNGWARHNWWRWKEDDTVVGNYDGSIDVDDETVDEDRDIFVFPFAATDGNNLPMYTAEAEYDADAQQWNVTNKWNKIEPRVLRLIEDVNHDAVGDFDLGMDAVILNHYADLASTMLHPVVITETVRMDDVTFRDVDETKAVYLAQHGAYFALLSLELKSDGTATAKLLKLVKQEEIQ